MNRKLKRQLYISAVALGGAFAIGPVISKADTVNVVAGDTVWGFAQKYHTSINKIVQNNHIKNPNLIYIGQKLLVPGKDTTTNSQDDKPNAANVAIPKKAKPAIPQKDNSLASSSTSTTTPSNSSSSGNLDSASNNSSASSSAAQSSSSTAVTSNSDSSSTASAMQNTDSEKQAHRQCKVQQRHKLLRLVLHLSGLPPQRLRLTRAAHRRRKTEAWKTMALPAQTLQEVQQQLIRALVQLLPQLAPLQL
jgi:FOG: LysM repeat